MKTGYAIILATIFVMIWISLAGATENRYPPCYFNPLCSCSKAVPDLGVVQCNRVPLPRVPQALNTSKLFKLKLVDNGLRDVEPYFLQSTGLYSLEVSEQPLRDPLPDAAFAGLERSLWELTLRNDGLTKVPGRALRHLQKLRKLDLTGNDIIEIRPSDWRGLSTTLQRLILKDNGLRTLPPDAFSGLPQLETMDLRGNSLIEIDPTVFREGMPRLAKLLLGDNLLELVPYEAVSPLKGLKVLDLRMNRIHTMVADPNANSSTSAKLQVQLNLDVLRLDHNLLKELDTLAFQYFGYVNTTILDGNPLNEIEDGAFRPAKIRELSLRYCKLTHLTPAALAGLESSLQRLDLSGNNLTALPESLLKTFDYLRMLSLRDNGLVEQLVFPEDHMGLMFSLTELDFVGSNNAATNFQHLKNMRNLRKLSISKIPKPQLDPEDFEGYGLELEELHITGGNIKSIKDHAFKYVRGIKKLDLSDNSIDRIDDEVFTELGHTLIELNLSHGLSSTISKMPIAALKKLEALRRLDFSNNKLRSVDDNSFHSLKKLTILELQDNEIVEIPKGTFQSDIHTYLQQISLQFNHIKQIDQHTFVDLPHLTTLRLDDNRIEHIERRAFMNLDNLQVLNLRGNKLDTVSDEAFQNLPKLRQLDMAYNMMKTFDFAMFDQVGTLALLKVNVSYNNIRELVVDVSSLSDNRETGSGGLHSNIKSLDLSHNNISHISRAFFRPAELSLTHLRLASNTLRNATWDVFGNMPHLQWLDLRKNKLQDVGWDAFRNTRKLQVLLLSGNELEQLHSDTFRTLQQLRVVDLSDNDLRNLPDGLFFAEGLEKLDLRNNILGRAPLAALSHGAASTLHDLDLSGNQIAALPNGELLGRFRSLRTLDLSHNRLLQLEEGVFAPLIRLTILDISHNPDTRMESDLRPLLGLEDQLDQLNLDNTSLAALRQMPLSNLRVLSIAGNSLPTLPAELSLNLSRLRDFDLSRNDFTTIPVLIGRLQNLRRLNLAHNPLSQISNSSLPYRLSELDLRSLYNLHNVEGDAFCGDTDLRVLRTGAWPNLDELLDTCYGLRELEIHVDKEERHLEQALEGNVPLPIKLKRITLSGKALKEIKENTLGGLMSHALTLKLYNTSVHQINEDVFKHVGDSVRDISIDVRGYNLELRELNNPNTGVKPNLPSKVFLSGLRLAGNSWVCNCELGWVETWLRKRRQYFCNVNDDDDDSDDESDFDDFNDFEDDACDPVGDDLREAKCSNKNNASVLEIMKSDLECGWSHAPILKVTKQVFALSFTIALFQHILIG